MEDNRLALEIVDRLGRIEGKLDSYNEMTKQVNTNTTEIEKTQKDVCDHERRLSGIEGWGKWLAVGVGGLLLQAVVSLAMR